MEADERHVEFGNLLYELSMDNPEFPIKEYAEKWAEEFPGHPVAARMSAAVLNGKAEHDPEFARKLFDSFADSFDEVLDALDYRVPELVGKVLAKRCRRIPFFKKRILDAGCGTGRCAKFLEPYAKFRGLEGVDISRKMLERAAQKKGYARLVRADLVKFLSSPKNRARYDIIVCADVLTYFADLEPLFEAAKNALREGGRFVFSIAENPGTGDYALHPSGRYRHSKAYVEKAMRENGFEVEEFNREILREEDGEPVWGYMVLCKM